jgi:hypothetical protein
VARGFALARGGGVVGKGRVARGRQSLLAKRPRNGDALRKAARWVLLRVGVRCRLGAARAAVRSPGVGGSGPLEHRG